MNRTITSICLTLTIAFQTFATPCKIEGPNRHRFLRSGWKSSGIEVFDASGTSVWKYASNDELSDAWSLADGGAAFSFSRRKKGESGVIRLDSKQHVSWEYRCTDGRNNHSCQPLPHGGFLLGESAKDGLWLVEIDSTGQETKRVQVADTTKDPHHAFRQVRKTPQGSYLGTIMSANTTYEWNAEGQLLRTFPNGVYVAIRLPNGNTLTSGRGSGPKNGPVVEFDPNGEVVWRLDQDDLPFQINMPCGLQRLPNGNTIVSNIWHGKHTDKNAPMLYEVTPEKQVVWKLYTPGGNMGNVQILDVPGNVYQGEVFK